MTEQNKFQDIHGLGLPDASVPMSSTKNISSGQKSADTYTKNVPMHHAKLSDPNNVSKKHGILGSTALANNSLLKEGSSYKIDKILEEFHNSNNSNFATGGSGPQGGGKGVNNFTAQGEKPTVKSYNNQVRQKIDDDRQRKNTSIRNAADVEPGTGMTARENTIGITQGATNTNAGARAQAAENHSRSLDQRDAQNQQGQ